jgi:hypothetical protein
MCNEINIKYFGFMRLLFQQCLWFAFLVIGFKCPEVPPSGRQRTVEVVPTALAGVAEQRDVTMKPSLKVSSIQNSSILSN